MTEGVLERRKRDLARKARYTQERRAAGMCTHHGCPNPPAEGLTTCGFHSASAEKRRLEAKRAQENEHRLEIEQKPNPIFDDGIPAITPDTAMNEDAKIQAEMAGKIEGFGVSMGKWERA